MSSVPPPPPPPPDLPPPPGGPPSMGPGSGSGPLDVGTAVSYGWKKFTEYPGPLILIVLIIAVVNLIGGVLRFTVENFVIGLILLIVFYIVGQILTIGIINASLMVTRGETPEPGPGVLDRVPRSVHHRLDPLRDHRRHRLHPVRHPGDHRHDPPRRSTASTSSTRG